MWVEWTPGVEAIFSGGDATIENGGKTMLLPGAADAIALLRDFLIEPKPLQELQEELSHVVAEESASGLLASLVNEQVLVFCNDVAELAQLHKQTITGGTAQRTRAAIPDGGMVRRQCGGAIPLTCNLALDKTLAETLLGRRSCWRFSGARMSLEQLGACLYLSASAGANGPPAPKGPGAPAANRAYPSAGALYPIEILIYTSNVEGIRPGFYYYQALGHQLSLHAGNLLDSNTLQLPFEQAIGMVGVLVLFFVDFLRQTLHKYGPKLYRLALIETGHIAQNIMLASEAIGLACLPICGFDDARLTEASGLRYPEQPIVYALAIGERQSKDAHA